MEKVMCTNGAFAVFALLLLAVVLGACGGGSASPALLIGVETAQALPVSEELLPAVPAGGSFNPRKITAAVTVELDGAAAYDHSAANVTLVGPQAVFAPAAAELAWAVYEFSGSPADEIGSVEYIASNRAAGHIVYVAISDYDGDRWQFIGARDQDGAALVPAPGVNYSSPNGYTYIAVLGFDGGGFDLEAVKVTYSNRYPVSGQVLDQAGAGIPHVTITTTLGGASVMTDGAGEFTLPAIPDGTWHLMATKPGWVFYENPQEIMVAGGEVTGLEVLGYMNESHFDPVEDYEPNDNLGQAPNRNPIVAVEDYISASDDRLDYYRYAFDTPGQYWFRLEPDSSVMFPSLRLYNKDGYPLAESSWAYGGIVYVGFTAALTRVVKVEVSCQGGGGHYTLTTGTGDLNGLEGTIYSGGGPQVMGYIKVGVANGSDQSVLFTGSLSGIYHNDFLLPVMTTVTPDPQDEDTFGYAPASQNVDLSTGDKTGIDFNGGGLLPLDSYEPNDSDLTAHEFAVLPLTSHDSVRLGDTDYQDWYKVTPTAGKYLYARIDVEHLNSLTDTPIYAYLFDSTATFVNGSFDYDEGVELRSEVPMDGNPYYIDVISEADTPVQYYMWIEEYTGYELDLGARWEGQGLQYARIDLYDRQFGNPGFSWHRSFTTFDGGLIDLPIRFFDGEELYAELFRYGLDNHRQTRIITFDEADEQVWFDCDPAASADSWEPNSSDGIAVDLPFSADATISHQTDPLDKYVFSTASTDPVHVSFTAPPNGIQFIARTWNITPEPDEQVDQFQWTGDADFLLETAGPAPLEHMLEILAYSEGETEYHLELDETPGYMLSGEVTDNLMAPVPSAYVYCPAINQVWLSSPLMPEANFELGPFQPGTYQIYVYAPNLESTPASPWTLNVGAGDVVQDFELNLHYTDVGEPNDTAGTATFLASGVPVSANVNSDGDSTDYYTFTTGGAGYINANIVYEKWYSNPTLTLYDTDGTTVLETSNFSFLDYQRIDYFLPGAGTYYLKVYLGFGANDYDITVTY